MAEFDNAELIDRLRPALNALSESVSEMLAEVTDTYDLTENQALSLALISLHARMRHVREGRMFISVPVESVEFFRSPLEVLLLGADPAYSEVYDSLGPESEG